MSNHSFRGGGELSYFKADESNFMVKAKHAEILEKPQLTTVYALNAKLYFANGESIERPDVDEIGTAHVAEYIGPSTVDGIEETEFMVIHLEEFKSLLPEASLPHQQVDDTTWLEESPFKTVISPLLITELHELVHWALSNEEQPCGTGHWEAWNNVLRSLVESEHDVEISY